MDVSQLPCGLNGALYFVEMDEDGGKGRFPTNKVGLVYLCVCRCAFLCVRLFANCEYHSMKMIIMISNKRFQHQSSQAGASFGTGYCDAQCPADLKFINGEANCMDWTGNTHVHI